MRWLNPRDKGANMADAAWKFGPMALLVLCLGLGGSGTAQAQEGKTDGLVPWIFQCQAEGVDAPLQCQMTQELFASDTKQRVVVLSVASNGAGGFELTLALPHGPLLPPGLALKVDDQEAVTVPIESSNQAGIFARVALEGEFGAAVKKGRQLSIGVTNRLGKLVEVPVSLAGFSAALKRLAALK